MAVQTFHGTTFHDHYPPREEPLSPPLSKHANENGGSSGGDDDGFLVYRDVIASPSSPVRNGEHDATPRMITGPIGAGGHDSSRVLLDAKRRPEEPPRNILERSGARGARTLETLRRIEAQDLEETRRKIETEHINRGEALRQAVLEVVRLQTQKAAIQSENLKMREALEKSKLTLEHHAFNEQRSRQMLQNAQAEIQQLQAMVSESNKLNAALMTKVQTLALRRDFQAPPSHMQQPFPAHLQRQPPLPPNGNTAAAMLAAATPRPSQAPQSQVYAQTHQQPPLMGHNPHLNTPLSLSSNFSRIAIETGLTDAERAEEAKMQVQLKEMMAAAIEEGRKAMNEEAEKKKAEEEATAAAAAAAESAEEAAANLKANNDAVEEAIRARREAEAKVSAVQQAMAAEHQAALKAGVFKSAASTIESIAASGAAVLQGRQGTPPQQPSAGNGYEAAALAAQNGDYSSALAHFSAEVQSRN